MDRSRPVILLVEDDHASPLGHRTLLESEGFDVMLARDGDAALERARANTPDLVLTDVMVRRTPGAEIAAALKSEARTADVPIVAMTSDDPMGIGPWDALVTKPCLPEELVACVKSLLYDRARASARSQRVAAVVS